jgi:hypothetical protein
VATPSDATPSTGSESLRPETRFPNLPTYSGFDVPLLRCANGHADFRNRYSRTPAEARYSLGELS